MWKCRCGGTVKHDIVLEIRLEAKLNIDKDIDVEELLKTKPLDVEITQKPKIIGWSCENCGIDNTYFDDIDDGLFWEE